MHIAIYPECSEWRMVKVFSKDADRKVVDADMRRLYSFDLKSIYRDIQAEPISPERHYLLVGNRQVSAVRNSFRQKAV